MQFHSPFLKKPKRDFTTTMKTFFGGDLQYDLSKNIININQDNVSQEESIDVITMTSLDSAQVLPQQWSESLNSSPILSKQTSRVSKSNDIMEEEGNTNKIDIQFINQPKTLYLQTGDCLSFQKLEGISSHNSSQKQSSVTSCSSFQPSQFESFDLSYQQPILPMELGFMCQMITPETFIERINYEQNTMDKRLLIIDCRFFYEFQGGHIKGAINICDPNQMKALLFANYESNHNQIIVMYCEFSEKRSPEMCKYIRNCDREYNVSNYPTLCFTDIYVLKEGYKNFYEKYQIMCEGNYIAERNSEFKCEQKKESKQLKDSWKNIKMKKNQSSRSFQEIPNQFQ